MFIAILAGGSGTRLWPLSRSHRPKQLLPLVSDRSLIQETVDRIRPLASADRVLVVTERSHSDAVRAQLPELPSGNFVIEPVRRGTAPALALASLYVEHADPSAVMASLHSDAVITNPEELLRALRVAERFAASSDHVVTLGVTPTTPATNFGYIKMAEQIGETPDGRLYRAERFVEKPDLEKARGFLATGDYLWNSGIFVWRVSVIMSLFETLMPGLHELLMKIKPHLSTGRETEVVAEIYPRMQKETIDFGIMERAPRVAVVPTALDWRDVGSWSELLDVRSANSGTNVVRGKHIGLKTERSLIFGSSKPVVTIGVEDLVVVDTEDVLLVASKEHAQDVKKIVEQLEADQELRYLC